MTHRSITRGFAAVTVALALFATACGGDDDKNGEQADASASTAAGAPEARATRASPSRAAATAVPADGIALSVVGNAGSVQYNPTAGEFRAFDKTTIKGKEGVSLATIAAKAAVTNPRLATIEGENPSNGVFGSIRYPVADISSNTILVMDDRGHLTLVSDKIPDAELLTNVSAIVFE